MDAPRLNKATLLRLAKYIRVLKQLKALGIVRVFSNNREIENLFYLVRMRSHGSPGTAR